MKPNKTVSANNNQTLFKIFMENSGWCWYQDPRTIIHKGKLVIGGIEGNSNGSAVIGIYDLTENKIIGRTVVNKKFDHDDHNSPVFFVRSDESLLTIYARHGRDNLHHYRVSVSEDCLKWGKEKVLRHNQKVTYMNLYNLEEEGTLYNFYRGITWNPTFVTSQNEGITWSNPTHFIQSEIKGIQRPYARYDGNGKNTVVVCFTDAHPRNFGNSLYYAEFRNGKFYKVDGTLIKDLKVDGPLKPSEADKVYQGGGGGFRGNNLSALRSAWNSSIVLDKNDRPHLAYSLYLSNTDHRYRMAHWDGSKWIDREVAYAGTCLYDNESSYTGLITLDPKDPTKVFISSNVNPSTGKPLNGRHQIFRGTISPQDNIKTIKWKQLTPTDPKMINIRPVIVYGDNYRIVLWQQGRFDSYIDYELNTVGIIEHINSR